VPSAMMRAHSSSVKHGSLWISGERIASGGIAVAGRTVPVI
jgi:hypothetical protein